MNIFYNFLKDVFAYKEPDKHTFILNSDINAVSGPQDTNGAKETEPPKIFSEQSKNLEFLKYKYNALINNDVIIRPFNICINNHEKPAFVIYIDGMVSADLVNKFVLTPLMNQKEQCSQQINNKLELSDIIFESILPTNNIKKMKTFNEVYRAINGGNCALFVDSIQTAFNLDLKNLQQRSINTPNNEVIVRGSQEAFVENMRTNTAILRRLINNENLIFENIEVGKVSRTSVSIGYINNIANDDLISEVKYRINNLNIDALISSGQLEQLIQDSPASIFPQIIATERPDKVVNYLFEGRAVLIINGNPYALVVPGVFVDFLSSPEDYNLKFQYSNLQKIIRLIASFFAVLLPGLYIAISNYHQELIPTELLFTITASRESVPFPTIVEILLMEISFELIREAGLRVPSPLGSTIGIVGALILGEAAVSASLVSPILIIIVAITAICSFSIPDLSLNSTFRIFRFIYILLGNLAGFVGIGVGIFVQIILMCSLTSFGVPYVTIFKNKKSSSSYFIPPVWKRERTPKFVGSKKKFLQEKISMLWRSK